MPTSTFSLPATAKSGSFQPMARGWPCFTTCSWSPMRVIRSAARCNELSTRPEGSSGSRVSLPISRTARCSRRMCEAAASWWPRQMKMLGPLAVERRSSNWSTSASMSSRPALAPSKLLRRAPKGSRPGRSWRCLHSGCWPAVRDCGCRSATPGTGSCRRQRPAGRCRRCSSRRGPARRAGWCRHWPTVRPPRRSGGRSPACRAARAGDRRSRSLSRAAARGPSRRRLRSPACRDPGNGVGDLRSLRK